jgi:hypothetical protein
MAENEPSFGRLASQSRHRLMFRDAKLVRASTGLWREERHRRNAEVAPLGSAEMHQSILAISLLVVSACASAESAPQETNSDGGAAYADSALCLSHCRENDHH